MARTARPRIHGQKGLIHTDYPAVDSHSSCNSSESILTAAQRTLRLRMDTEEGGVKARADTERQLAYLAGIYLRWRKSVGIGAVFFISQAEEMLLIVFL